MAFLDTPAYGTANSWRSLLDCNAPQQDASGCLGPPWGDAIRAAANFEASSPGWESDPKFADGPAGQVISYLREKGYGGFEQAANLTESTARAQAMPMQQPMMMGQPMMPPATMGQPMMAPAQMGAMGGGGGPPHIAALNQQSGIEVKEKVNWIEALSAIIGQEIEMGNKYKVFSEAGEELFYAVEETGCIMRQVKQCFPDCAPWNLKILYTQGGNQQLAYDLQRDWTCTFCCFNRPVVRVKDVIQDKDIGLLQDPFACCDLTFNVRDPDGTTIMTANGGCCQWGLCCPLPCGPCAKVTFPLQDAKTGSDIGELQKKVPGCFKFLAAPDVENYKVDFKGVTNPDYKALLMALTIFIDFRYFNENRNDDEGGLVGMMTE